MSKDDDAHERAEYERELAHFERTRGIKPHEPGTPTAKALRLRAKQLVDLMFRVARPGDDLHTEIEMVTSETENTTRWRLRDGYVEVVMDRVFPAMAALPSQHNRDLTFAAARVELLEVLVSVSQLESIERQWLGLALTRGVEVSHLLAPLDGLTRARAALAGLRLIGDGELNRQRGQLESILLWAHELVTSPKKDREVSKPRADQPPLEPILSAARTRLLPLGDPLLGRLWEVLFDAIGELARQIEQGPSNTSARATRHLAKALPYLEKMVLAGRALRPEK